MERILLLEDDKSLVTGWPLHWAGRVMRWTRPAPWSRPTVCGRRAATTC